MTAALPAGSDLTTRARRREGRVLLAAALANGPAELLDFILPLWAGTALGASATQVGVLIAVELAVSVVVRPFAGIQADRFERRHVAAAGALIYALSCAGYVVADSLPLAWAAAVLGGLGGALFWVAVRAMVGERLAEDSAVYPRLTSAEETGAWVSFVAGLSLIGMSGYRSVFLACACACLAAAVVLLSAPRRVASPAPALPGSVARRLRPMLVAVAVTMAAEAAIALLLLLHLQRHFELEILQIAYVFLPGAIAIAVLPERLHRFVLRYGRVRVLALASVLSAVFAVGLAWAPNPLVIAALWVLSGVAWAAVIPIQQAVVAEASGAQVGRGMGLYESAVLLGTLAGSLLAGALYDELSWPVACLATAAVILTGAGLVPWSVRALGVVDKPAGSAELGVGTPASMPEPVSGPTAGPASEAAPEPAGVPAEQHDARPPRSRFRSLGQHSMIFLVVQIVLAAIDLSWLRDLGTGAVDPLSNTRDVPVDGLAEVVYHAGRIWAFVLVIDVVWTVVTSLRRRPGR
ncbi:MFS transporter [Actinoplanes sp. DH11]|uniref:MFS transporter n=1 Tax=Actinoplanes sp. DH11 TaxID=2857011 RepID=UPI001E4895D8|nr:MFS transporter [Actinoplanes sp. DH11]